MSTSRTTSSDARYVAYAKMVTAIACVLCMLPLSVRAADEPTNTSTDTTGNTGASAASSYRFQRQGIFDCNQNGSYAMSVGAMSAIGGAYVPVNDAAVTLNTGTLVYKECVLREVVDRMSEKALTDLQKQQTRTILTGRNGNPYFAVNLNNEDVAVSDAEFVYGFLQNDALWENIPTSMQGALKRSAAKYYEGERSGLQATSLKCPYQGDLRAFQQGALLNSSNFWADFFNASAPQCDPIVENFLLEDLWSGKIARALQYQTEQRSWGRGYYPRVNDEREPLRQDVLTPAVNIQEGYQQVLDTGIQKLVNANDVGQMVGGLYAGLSTQIAGDTAGLGLAGVTRSIGGQPSYMDQLAAESAAGLQGATNNVALVTLNAALQVESAYYQAMSAIVSSLTTTRQQLRSAENTCFSQVIGKVCSAAPNNSNVCNGTDGTQYTVATSTAFAFADAVINARIAPLLPTATANVQASQTALQLINGLIQSIANTSSANVQYSALQQLDQLVAQHRLHTQTDLANAGQQRTAVTDQMSSTLTTTAQVWGGTGSDGSQNFPWDAMVNPGTGWCNYNNSATIDTWKQKWKQ